MQPPTERSSAAKEPRFNRCHPEGLHCIPDPGSSSRWPRGAAAAAAFQVAEDHNRLPDLRVLHAQERKSYPVSPPLRLHGSLLAIRKYLWGIQKAKQLNIQESQMHLQAIWMGQMLRNRSQTLCLQLTMLTRVVQRVQA